MKKILSIMVIILFLAGCSVVDNEKPIINSDKISAVWIYYSEISMKSQGGGTQKQFRDKTEQMFKNCSEMGINTVFYHVRPFCDALYKSDIFPWSSYLTGIQGKDSGYDPLKIAIEIAHSYNITLHAWINPFRILADNDYSVLSKSNPAKKWIEEKSPNVININNGWYFSPGSAEAQKLIVDGIREIVKKYDVDGIHIDDYFYPSTDEKVDSVFYKQYKNSGGELNLKKWRLNTVSAFVAQMYSASKAVSKNCIFSISPAGNIKNNYNEQYADVRLWLSEKGYADWIIPQLYYGFKNEKLPFNIACESWSILKKHKDVELIYGIGAYKINDSDEEWNCGSGIIDKQLEYVAKKEDFGGAAFFSYSSMIDPERKAEFDNIKAYLK